MESKDKWIEKVLQSSAQLEQLNPNPFLFSKIKTKIESKERVYLNIRQTRWAMAGGLFLILFNFMILKDFSAIESTDNEIATTQNIESQTQTSDYAFLEDDFELNYLND